MINSTPLEERKSLPSRGSLVPISKIDISALEDDKSSIRTSEESSEEEDKDESDNEDGNDFFA